MVHRDCLAAWMRVSKTWECRMCRELYAAAVFGDEADRRILALPPRPGDPAAGTDGAADATVALLVRPPTPPRRRPGRQGRVGDGRGGNESVVLMRLVGLFMAAVMVMWLHDADRR
ncbi:MAG: hypothetical protein VYE81_03700 [Planctomycetota bacterium]|nr:hypothetical protein [Planctomycetota bacterium]